MPRADVLQLIADLSGGQADAVLAERYYDDVVDDLGRRQWLTQASLLTTTANTGTYRLPADGIRLLGVFYGDELLDRVALRTLEAYDPHWRDAAGTPIAYTVEDETTNEFRLFPVPTVPSQDFIFLFGSPFGADFAERAVAVVHTERRDDLPLWLELPVAFDVLAREFARESDHRDPAFAEVARRLAATMYQMVA